MEILCPLSILAMIFIGLLPYIGATQATIARTQERGRKIALANAKLEALRTKAEALAALREARIEAEHDKNEVRALQIELLALKIRKEQRNQGLNDAEFTPKDYDSGKVRDD